MTKRAISYGRVSTDDQAEKGYSLPSQLENCRRYAQADGYEVIAEITDDISGAVPIAERSGGKQVQELLDQREADAVIVHHVDRLSRDIIDLLQTCRDWLRAGIDVFAGDVGWIESELDIVLVIKGWQGGDERRKIKERTMRGRYAKARAGKVVGGGQPPYGYKYADGKFEIIKTEAEVVRLIYLYYTAGKNGGPPMVDLAIARELSKMGLQTPGERNGSALRTRAPGMWSGNAVRRILTTETYAGILRYGRRTGSGGKRGKRPKKDQIPIPVPAIVSRELWNAAQERREFNKRTSRRNCRRKYLLRGLIECECGYAMHGQWETSGKLRYYYRCGEGRNRHAGLEKQRCNRLVRGEMLDARVWDAVVDIMTVRERFEEGLHCAREAELNALQPKRHRLEFLDELVIRCEREAQQSIPKLTDLSPGSLMSATLQGEIDRLETEYSKLTKERDTLQAELETELMTDEDIAAALDFREEIVAGMVEATFEVKRDTLEDLRVHVKLINDEQARVTCRIKGAERTITFDTSKKDN